jgi:hypothetical protein
MTDSRLVEAVGDIQSHHTFPDSYLTTSGGVQKDPHIVANLTPITGATNAALRDNAPATVLARNDIVRSAIETHGIDVELFDSQDYGAFLQNRADWLVARAREAVANATA